jgi:hypothetical protein
MVIWPRAATNVSSRSPPVRVSLPGDLTTSCAMPSVASRPVGSTPPKVPLSAFGRSTPSERWSYVGQDRFNDMRIVGNPELVRHGQ